MSSWRLLLPRAIPVGKGVLIPSLHPRFWQRWMELFVETPGWGRAARMEPELLKIDQNPPNFCAAKPKMLDTGRKGGFFFNGKQGKEQMLRS